MNSRQRELLARALRLEAEAKQLRADAVLAGGDDRDHGRRDQHEQHDPKKLADSERRLKRKGLL